MKTKDFIKYLQEYEIDDHGRESDIGFYDVENDRWLELTPQSSNEPGIEHNHYMGCGCISGFTINLMMEKENE